MSPPYPRALVVLLALVVLGLAVWGLLTPAPDYDRCTTPAWGPMTCENQP